MSGTPSLALRSLGARPSRTLLTLFGIVLGVSVILAISITNLSTIDSITAIFSQASGKANVVVISSDITSQGFRQDVLRQVSAVPGVQAAIPSLQPQTMLADTAAARGSISFVGAVGAGFALYGIDPSLDTLARDYKIVAGEFLPPDLDAYEIVLVKDYADANKIELGRDVKILTPEGTQALRVVGLISKEGPGQLNNGAFAVMPLGAAQKIFDRSGRLDQIDIVAQPQMANGAALDRLIADLQARLGDKYTVTYPANQGKRVVQMLEMYELGLNFFSVIALFVGAFLIYNAFSMTVVERIREIGMLRAVGMTQRQVMRQILAEAGILGIAGSLLGVAAGVVLARGLIRVMEFVLSQPVKQTRVPLDGLVTSVVVGICVTFLAAAIPAWQASRVSPLEALQVRGKPDESWLVRHGWTVGVVLLCVASVLMYSNLFAPTVQAQVSTVAVFALFSGATLVIPAMVVTLDRVTGPVFGRIYGREGQLGSGNIRRSKLRTALTVAALMVGVAMILGIRSMTDAFRHDIRNWMDGYIAGDLFVHSSLPMQTDLGSRLQVLEGVENVTAARYFQVEMLLPNGGSEEVAFMAVDPQSYGRVTTFMFTSGQGDPNRLMDRLAQGDAVFMSSTIAEKYHLKQGDTVRLETRRGQQDFSIAAIVVDFGNRGFVVDGSWNDMRRYFGLNNVSAFLVKVKPGYSPADVRARILDTYGHNRHVEVESNQAVKTLILSVTAEAFTLFDVLALIAMIVAALGVINTLTMSVLERTREIGMLRAVGMTRLQVRRMILAEAGIMGLIGGLFGLVMGLFMSRLFVQSVQMIQGIPLTYMVPAAGILAGLALSLVISQLAALWPAQRAARIQVIEALQYE